MIESDRSVFTDQKPHCWTRVEPGKCRPPPRPTVCFSVICKSASATTAYVWMFSKKRVRNRGKNKAKMVCFLNFKLIFAFTFCFFFVCCFIWIHIQLSPAYVKLNNIKFLECLRSWLINGWEWQYTHPNTHRQKSCPGLIFIMGFKWRAQRQEVWIAKTTHQPVQSPTPPTHSLDRLSRGKQESRDWVLLNES